MIRREDVADLREGDVVEITLNSGTVIRGPLVGQRGLDIAQAGWSVRRLNGEPSYHLADTGATLTLVSRAPRPLYVNHDRTEPVPGDVVRDGHGDVRYAMPRKSVPIPANYAKGEIRWWAKSSEHNGEWLHCSTDYMRAFGPITLLLDGETGQVVP